MNLSPTAETIDVDRIRAARIQAQADGRRLIDVLEEQSHLAPESFLIALSQTLTYPLLHLDVLDGWSPAFDILPYGEAVEHECVVLRHRDGRLALVFCDPFAGIEAWADARIEHDFTWYLAHRRDLAAFLARHEETLRAMDGALGEREAGAPGDGPALADLSLRAIQADASPVVRLVHSTIYDALKLGASDIHLETAPGGLAIRYRLDGVLAEVGRINGRETAEQVISRIKIMSELDIAERRIPQDGRFKIAMQGRAVDFRVSVMPSLYGEDAVLRALDKRQLSDEIQGLRLDALGFDPQSIATLRRLAREPYGMLLVTGPTGSGKTTTLYAAISEINQGNDKIVTIEDPVEYQLPGVLQIPVNEKKGLTFARGLRSILRHDPDKIMVGEIRDPETAQIAVQSALTGHLVFTTVHANNVFDVIGRFTHMGVEPYSFVSALNGILAQRLLRLNCPHCSVAVEPAPQLLADSGVRRVAATEFRFRAGRGCEHCRGTGYKGRKAVAEVLSLNDELRERIVAREPLRVLKETALRQGTRFLREAALELARRGETTLEEINRVTFVA